jgi:hypothetical protein
LSEDKICWCQFGHPSVKTIVFQVSGHLIPNLLSSKFLHKENFKNQQFENIKVDKLVKRRGFEAKQEGENK